MTALRMARLHLGDPKKDRRGSCEAFGVLGGVVAFLGPVPARDLLKSVFAEALGEIILGERAVRLLVIDPQKEVIIQWIPSTPGETPSNVS